MRSLTEGSPPTLEKDARRVEAWIAAHVKGQSFLDVGGLWGTENEKVSVALQGGASEAAMMDIVPLSHSLWTAFDTRCRDLGIAGYRSVQANLDDADVVERVGTYDMVNCSGVLYHAPNPLHTLGNLYRLVRRHLILASVFVPASVENDAGAVEIGDSRAFFVPALTTAEHRVLAAHFTALHMKAVGLHEPVTNWIDARGIADYSPWWWLWSVGYLERLLATANFEIQDMAEVWEHRVVAFLCTKRPL